MDRPNPVIPAATLVLFRDGPDGAEHLFVERAATMAFAGGALVFPGGRVDPGDRALAEGFADLDPDDAAARIAAIRETIEEAGVGVGLIGGGDIDRLRDALAAGADFGNLLAAQGLSLDLAALVPFARWCPNFSEARTFDTRFYLARAAHDHAEARVDATENVHLFWATAADALARSQRGEVRIIFPTRRNLERLAGLAGFAGAVADATSHPQPIITPWVEGEGDGRTLHIPSGLGYPVTSELLATAFRA